MADEKPAVAPPKTKSTTVVEKGPVAARSETASIAVLIDIADTTWRMFIPTIGLLLVGRHFDGQFGTKPWLMLLGVVIGSMVAGLLIKDQLTRGGSGS